MAFDRDYLTCMGYGGKGGNSIWHYFDVNADNVASIANATINTTYFLPAFLASGIVARTGDIILVASRTATTQSVNTCTPIMLQVPSTWDVNGASVVRQLLLG